MLRTIVAKLTRRIVLFCVAALPVERRRRVDRWLRGREQYRRLRSADVVVVSHGKSGRTWLRVMLTGYYRRVFQIAGDQLLGFDNLHRADRRVPKIFFTHDNYLKDYTGNADTKRDFYDKKVVLMVRRPEDVVVSEYFNWRHRMKPSKMYLNDFPPHGADVSVYDFAMRPCGLDRVLEFMNGWARELPQMRDVLVVRYEDMREDAAREFRRVARFLEAPISEDALRYAVDYASVDNMRRMERGASRWSGGRLRPRDPDNPHSYKVRRAQVGGYRDYLDAEQTAEIDARVAAELAPLYGYGGETRPAAPAPPA